MGFKEGEEGERVLLNLTTQQPLEILSKPVERVTQRMDETKE